ncbi:MAG: M15 family metallopeptidase [Geminocystis sp.]|nr:M15 family metallopeptidase [Geminocystis sp.]MCS7148164.1 M15 family metallopeptidase [Geminocystis sp.]MCX8078117.1 M15 family metallopeptidase [Geminocystis sp.]MDW8116515.1 M15 family metallopeptidase [Geminocystis sp.]MDW8462002.1 M15 family metallopeptidase [Geminocystis sp.]
MSKRGNNGAKGKGTVGVGVFTSFQILNFLVSLAVVSAVALWYYNPRRGESQKEGIDVTTGEEEKGKREVYQLTPHTPSDPGNAVGKTESRENANIELGGVAKMAEIVCNNSRLGHFYFPEASKKKLVEVGGYYNRREYLHREAAGAFKRMREDAGKEGVELVLISGFRGVEVQGELFNRQIQRKGGMAAAARWSAPPGYSEHHTGYALDIGDGKRPEWNLKLDFAKSEAHRWLTEKARGYGFEQSFPANNPQGVGFEPWHWRFVGSEDARRVFAIPRYFTQVVELYSHSGLLPTNSGAGILFSLCEDSMGKVLGGVRFSPR